MMNFTSRFKIEVPREKKTEHGKLYMFVLVEHKA
jgi:hypothetical protein